jgi:cell shape-determining protein MreD
LNLIFSGNYLINLSILAVISWVITSSFEKIWPWIIALGFFNDIFLAQKIGSNILFFILLAYLVSFISKRFIIERHFSGFLLVIVFILIGNFGGSIFNFLFVSHDILGEFWLYLKSYFINWESLALVNIFSGICFYLVYVSINRVEKYIAKSESRLNISL